MRNVWILYAVFLFPVNAIFAQEHQVKVSLKDGVTLIGQLKQMDTTNSLTIQIGGIDISIPMSDVLTVENMIESGLQHVDTGYSLGVLPAKEYGRYEITDRGEYPDSFVVSVDSQQFTMVLVRGGVFNMGYDGRGSRSFKSEPVHRVELSSFYVSKELISAGVAYGLLKNERLKNIYSKRPDAKYITEEWEDAKIIVDSIAELLSSPFRLLTEAEWEYASIVPESKTIFSEYAAAMNERGEWCSDFWAEFDEYVESNPIGPKEGKRHVVRIFTTDEYKWNRNLKYMVSDKYGNVISRKYYARIAISANQILDKIK